MSTEAGGLSAVRSTLVPRLYRGLFATGFVCLGYCVFVLADAGLYGVVQERQLERALGEGPDLPGPSFTSRDVPSVPSVTSEEAPSVPRPPRPARVGALIGRLEVPRLALRALVAEGVDRRTLRRAVGHLPGTALPGETGNVALAGHRDTFFRSLREIQAGDLVRLVTPSGSFQYIVESTSVVEPSRAEVLDATEHPSLTLITCYPFYFVGPAPDRFVVRARLQDGVAAARLRD